MNIKNLNTPWKVQEFINELEYNEGKRISIRDVYEKRIADCLEAACFASYILTEHKIENWIMDLESVRDEDHVLCVFKVKGLYGAIAQSKYLGLRNRHPVYKTPRELAMSYFDNYFNYFGEYTLRGMSPMIKYDFSNYLDESKTTINVEKKLMNIKHIKLVKEQKFPRVTKTKFQREIILTPKNKKVGKRYI